jgi:hypothetical protein
MNLYHKVWGEVNVVDYDDKYITLSLKNNETKKLLLSSIGTHLFNSQSEMNERDNKNNEVNNQKRKADEFRKHYRELGIEDTLDNYNSTIADYENIDWSMLSKPDKKVPDGADALENDVDEEEDLLEHFSEEII